MDRTETAMQNCNTTEKKGVYAMDYRQVTGMILGALMLCLPICFH